MKTCNLQAGQKFLDGTMTDEQETDFVAHLDTCPNCQSHLEQSAGSDADWGEAQSQLILIPSLHDTEPNFSAAPTNEFDLAFLAPTDDPQMLGRIGPYEVTGIIGRGGMGIVVKAFDKPLNRYVAIKVLDPRLASQGIARQRFAREARAMAAISHEHVVPVFAVEEHTGLPYLVMEYIAGTSLEKCLRRNGPLDVLAIVRVGLQVAQALAAAHAQGLVHRDIKPANILLNKNVERIKVGDFGLAHTPHEASFTHTGAVMGTPEFMAPEQVRGETCGPAADLFGLGALMYAMSCGGSPFRAETIYGVMQRVLEEPPKSIRSQNPDVPAWLEQFIERLLEKNPADRFDSSEEVAHLLEKELAYLRSPTTTEKPNRNWARHRSPSQRNKKNITISLPRLSALLVATLLVAIGWTIWPIAKQPIPIDPIPKEPVDIPVQVYSGPPPLLWDADGTDELADRVQALAEQLTPTPQEPPTPDTWNQDIDQLQQKLSEMHESNSW